MKLEIEILPATCWSMLSTLSLGRWSPALLIHNVENARSLGLPQAQIFVASRRQALQMTEHPLPNARFAAVAFPDNGDGRHGAKSP